MCIYLEWLYTRLRARLAMCIASADSLTKLGVNSGGKSGANFAVTAELTLELTPELILFLK